MARKNRGGKLSNFGDKRAPLFKSGAGRPKQQPKARGGTAVKRGGRTPHKGK